MRTATRIFREGLLLAPLAALSLLAAGCGSKNQPGLLERVVTKPHPAPKRAVPFDGISPDMVTAVSATKGTAAVQVKFELTGRPDVGEPVDVNLVIVPLAVGLDEISGKIQAEDGLQILSGDVIAAVEKPVAATPISHTLKIRPQREGIFTLSTVISSEYGGQATTQTFAFPVIAGNGLADAAAPARLAGAGAKPAASAAPQ
jgi:hypothetical protein